MARVSKYFLDDNRALPSTRKWKAGLYLRLSKEDGDNDEDGKTESDSIVNQRLICENFLADNFDIDFADEYVDDGYSGSTFDRPDFVRLIEDIRLGRINCVIVKDLSRFGRSYLDAGQYLEIFFPMMDIRFISILDNIDSFLDPRSMSDITVSFKNIMNEEYCRDISKKIRSTFVAKRENGEYICGFALYGYVRDPVNRGQLLIDPEAAENVRMIFSLYAQGMSYRGITFHLNSLGIPSPAKYKSMKYPNYNKSFGLGIWNIETVRSILKNRMFVGDLVQGKYEKISHKINKIRRLDEGRWVIVENHHEPIVDRELYTSVQRMMSRKTRISPKSKELALFSGFLVCADCGHKLVKRNPSQEKFREAYHYYTCSTYDSKTKNACSRHTTRSDVLEKVVYAVITKYIDLAVNMDELIKKINLSPKKITITSKLKVSLENKERERKKIESYLMDLYPDLKNGLLSKEQYVQLKDKYERELKDVSTVIQNLSSEIKKDNEGIDGKNPFISNFLRFRNFDKLTREILIALVDVIYVHEGGKYEICFKFRDAFQDAINYIQANKNLVSNSAEILKRISTTTNMEVSG